VKIYGNRTQKLHKAIDLASISQRNFPLGFPKGRGSSWDLESTHSQGLPGVESGLGVLRLFLLIKQVLDLIQLSKNSQTKQNKNKKKERGRGKFEMKKSHERLLADDKYFF